MHKVCWTSSCLITSVYGQVGLFTTRVPIHAMLTIGHRLSGALGHALGFESNEVPADLLAPVPGAQVPGLDAIGQKCQCEIPAMSLKGLQAEDGKFIKNIDPYTFKGLVDKRPEGEKAFDYGFKKLMYEKDAIDKSLTNLRASWTTLDVKKRAAEHAQQRAAWTHFNKCRKFKHHYGLFLPCEETFRETMEIYRDAHQDPTCEVGGSLPLAPASLLPIDVDSQTAGILATAAVAISAHRCRGTKSKRDGNFLSGHQDRGRDSKRSGSFF